VQTKALVQKLYDILGTRERARLSLIGALIALGALVETAGVAAIPAYVALLNDPDTVIPLVRSYGVDLPLLDAPPETLILLASIGLALFFLVKNSFLVLVTYAQARFVAEGHTRLADRLLGAYLHSPYTFHLNRNTAELVRNITYGAPTVFSGVLTPGFLLVAEVLVIAFVGTLLLVVVPGSTLLAGATIGIAALVYYRFIRAKVLQLGELQQESAGQMIKWINQSLGGVKETKVLGRERFFLTAYLRNVVPYARAGALLHTISHLPRLLIETVALVGLMAVIITLIMSGRGVQSVLPSLVLFAVAALRLMPSVNRIISSLTTINYYRPSVDAVHADLLKTTEPDGPDRSGAGEAAYLSFRQAIELRDVWYRYPEATEDSLRGVSLHIPKGSSVAFVGPSGVGKTTCIDILLGLLSPTRGEVLVDGVDVRQALPAWQRMIGYIPQHIYLSDDSIRNNVAFGVPAEEIRDEDVWAALEAAQLATFVRRLPQQLDTFVGERGVRLSGGQRQRIGIARALYHQPEILVMDEATSALDHRTERDITEVLNQFHNQKTIIIIAHRLSTVRRCDILFLMAEGQVVSQGSYDELLEQSVEFQQMVG